MLVEIRQRQNELKEFDEKKKQVDDDISNLKEDNRKMNEANKTELEQEIEGIVNEKEKKMNERIQTTEQFLNDFKISLTDDIKTNRQEIQNSCSRYRIRRTFSCSTPCTAQ